MSTTAIKLGSLAIRTLAKPIANRIKHQAREHPRFRKLCAGIAQNVHRIDMRLRLGLLRDPATTERAAKRAEEAEHARRHQEAIKKMKEAEAIYPGVTGTVPSNIPAPPPLMAVPSAGKEAAKEAVKEAKPRIRPLSEAKAVENGANFISEAFLFAVAGGLILAEQVRSRRKEANRRDVVAERLELLESRTNQDEERLRTLEEQDLRNEELILRLEEEVWRLKGGKGEPPYKERRGARKIIEPIPLWKAPEDGEGSFWSKIWNAAVGSKEGSKEQSEVVLKVPEKQKAAVAEQVSPPSPAPSDAK